MTIVTLCVLARNEPGLEEAEQDAEGAVVGAHDLIRLSCGRYRTGAALVDLGERQRVEAVDLT
jgi:hypothetical protein